MVIKWLWNDYRMILIKFNLLNESSNQIPNNKGI